MIHWSYLDKLSDLAKSGHNFMEVTVVSHKGSIPQEVGAKLFYADHELIWGTVGGGKIEARVLEKCAQMLESESEAQLITWNLQKDIGMTCGGEVTLFFQKYGTSSNLKIALFGAGHVSQSLCHYFSRLDVSVTCFDTRSEWIEKIAKAPNIKAKVSADLASEVKSLCDSTFIISMTMGHKSDLPVLVEALNKGFPYVGVIGSKGKRNVLEKELLENGVSQEKIDSLICPIGMPFGKNTPDEISISILAEILTLRDEIFH